MVRYVLQALLFTVSNRRLRAAFFLMLLLCISTAQWQLPVQAQSPGITSPATGSSVNGAVPIMGTAVIEPFQKYELHFKQEPSGDDAYIYFDGSTEPVVNGQLGVWQAEGLPPGTYSLRLRVVKNDGNYAEYFAQNITVGGAAETETEPTPTPTSDEPTPTPIPTATFTPAPQPTVNVGQVGQPQVAGAVPTTPPTDTPAVESVAVAPEGEVADTSGAAAADTTGEQAGVIVNIDDSASETTDVDAESASLTRQIGEALSIQRLRTHFFNGVRYSAAIFMVIGLIFVGKRILVWVRTQV